MSKQIFPENLTREFDNSESSARYIIPTLRLGYTVTVTRKVAQLFKLSNIKIVQGGTAKDIIFSKTELGLWEMKLE